MPHSLADAFMYARAVRDEVFRLTENLTLPLSGCKYIVLHTFVAVAIEHQRAIVALADVNLYGSAHALERLLLETVARGLWVNKCATPDQVLGISQNDGEPYPKFREMCRIVDQEYALEGYFTSLTPIWKPLCSYTHSGLFQLGRRLKDGNVAPDYTEEEIAGLLDRSASCLIALLLLWFEEMSLQDKYDDLSSLLNAYTTV